jgi:hypothetical protein
MAGHVPGKIIGYVVTSDGQEVRKKAEISQNTLRQIASLLGVPMADVTGNITKILAGDLKIDVS